MSVAIVTGASRGFGLALTQSLVTRGWHVVVDARDAATLAAATDALADSGRVSVLPGDVTDPAHRQELVEAAARAGGLDLLVHNASALGPSPLPVLESAPLSEFHRVLETNVLAPVALTQLALPLLAEASAPAIVTLSSDAAVEPYAGWGAYGASKAALDHAAAILAVERPDIRVYAFDPGDMRTDMHQRAFPGEDISDRAEPDSVVPALLRLFDERPASGRYRASDLAAQVGA